MMEQVWDFGGFAVAAAMMFVLLQQMIKSFTKELEKERALFLGFIIAFRDESKEERAVFTAAWKEFLALELKEHDELNKKLDTIFMEVKKA